MLAEALPWVRGTVIDVPNDCMLVLVDGVVEFDRCAVD